MVFVWAVVGIMKLTYMAVKGTVSSGVPLLVLVYFFTFCCHFISPIFSNISNISQYQSFMNLSYTPQLEGGHTLFCFLYFGSKWIE